MNSAITSNILHLEASPGWGGQEIRILREAQGMKSRGHTIVFAVERAGILAREACKAGFTVYEVCFEKRAWLWTFWRLLAIMRRHHIDIVNTHSSLDAWVGAFTARILRIPIIRTRHLSTPVRPGWNSRLLYASLADFVVTTSSCIIPMISTQSGQPLERIRCIATGVDPAQMVVSVDDALMFRRRLNLASDDFLVGTACFMRSWKGIFDLLAAANQLRNEKKLKWIIIGGGHEEAYRKRAADLSLEGIVYFTGHLSNPIVALNALDVFILLSTAHEGISQAILQAAYLGKPLIATQIGGSPEVCLNNRTGLLVPPFSPDKVTQAVMMLMENREMREKLGRQAHEHVMKQFTWQHTLDGMEEICRQLTAHHYKSMRK
jgi:glycosyltransferase involved in cell wall biosynthesis